MSVTLPAMQSPTPIDIPAQESRSYRNLFLTKLQVERIPGQLDHSVVVGLAAYNYEASQLSDKPEHQWNHRISALLPEATRVPMLAEAMGKVVQVTGLLFQEASILKQLAFEEDEQARTTLNSQLIAVRVAMGIEA